MTHGIAFAERLVRRLPHYLSEATPFRALDLGQGTERDDSLEATLYLSYAPLSPDAKAAFRALGVLAPEESFSARTAFATWDVDPNDEVAVDDAYDTLAALVSAGLIVHEPETGRYRQHLLLHAYARALATRENEHDRALGRYTWHVIHDIAGQFETLPMEQWDAVIGPDLPHVHHVGNALAGYLQGIVFGAVPLEDLAQPDPPDDLLQEIDTDTRMAQALLERGEAFAEATKNYVYHRRVSEAGLHWLRTGLVCARVTGNDAHEILFLNHIGLWQRQRGQFSTALSYYENSLTKAREVHDRVEEATTLNNIAEVYRNTSEFERALEMFQQALSVHREVGNRNGESITLNNIGLVYDHSGNYEDALQLYNQALAISREIHNRSVEANIINNIAVVYFRSRKYSQALHFFQQALTIYRQIADRAAEGVTLNNIANIHNSNYQYKQALSIYLEALAIHREVNNRATESITLNNIAHVYTSLGEHDRALDFFQQALAIACEVGDRVTESAALHNIGHVYRNLDKPENALNSYQEALAIFRETGDQAGEASSCFNIGVLLHEVSAKTTEAILYLEQSTAILENIGDPHLDDARAFLTELRRSLNDATSTAPPAE